MVPNQLEVNYFLERSYHSQDQDNMIRFQISVKGELFKFKEKLFMKKLVKFQVQVVIMARLKQLRIE